MVSRDAENRPQRPAPVMHKTAAARFDDQGGAPHRAGAPSTGGSPFGGTRPTALAMNAAAPARATTHDSPPPGERRPAR